MKRKDVPGFEEHCRKAIRQKPDFPNGHYELGLIFLERKEYTDAVIQLQKALDVARSTYASGYLVDEISEKLAEAKYMEWEVVSARRSEELKSFKENCEAALNQQRSLDMSRTVEEASSSHTERLKALDRVFEKAAEEDTPTEVPHYLCCKITLKIFKDPAIAPNGITYERAAILEHSIRRR